MQYRIDFVEGEPVFYAVAVAFKEYPAVSFVEVDKIAAYPAVVLFCKVERCFVVADSDKRFDAVFFKFIKHTVVEGETFLIRFCFITVWEDT